MKVYSPRPALPILTSLRFFAAAEVVVYHEFRFSPNLMGPSLFLRDMASAGYEAVTFFFVLSGFILTYVYAGHVDDGRSSTSAPAFWRARFARIYPAYVVGLALALPHHLFAGLISKIISVPHLLGGTVLVPFMLQAWVPGQAIAWNAPAWSLSVEFFFYACFPALLFASARMSRTSFALLAYGLVLATAAIRYAIVSSGAASDPVAVEFEQYFPLFHLPQFIFGMALGRIFTFANGPASQRAYTAMFAAGVFGLAIILGARSWLPTWSYTDASLVLLFGLVIFGGAKMENKTLSSPLFILLGEASYAIYILHAPIGWLWVWLTRSMHLPNAASFAIYSGILIASAITTYLYVEKPLRRRILGHREHQPA